MVNKCYIYFVCLRSFFDLLEKLVQNYKKIFELSTCFTKKCKKKAFLNQFFYLHHRLLELGGIRFFLHSNNLTCFHEI
jgi:hypothetical protein